jgi:3-hydroxyisobutyrate dehydrogenase-like beta-hydroxyacid dehydrogenase
VKIGIIGLGNMGSAIAARLINAGHDVSVYNRTKSKAQPLVQAGAMLAKQAKDATGGDAFITMLSNDEAIEKTVFDTADGIISNQGKETIHLSMSTISPALCGRMAQEYAARNLPFVSAPVLGRPDVAERGELVVMAAGQKRLIADCQPIFDAIASKVHILGDSPAQANVAKVSANYMISAMIQTFGEALTLVTKGGVDANVFYEMVAYDFFKSPVYQKYGKIIVDRNFQSGAFSISMQAKDTRLASDCARQLECPMPFLSVLQDTFLSALARGKGSLDPCAITEVIAENAGVKSCQ